MAFDNRWLTRLSFAPRTRLVCTLLTHDGHITRRVLTYSLWDDDGRYAPREVIVFEALGDQKFQNPLDVHGHWSDGLWRMYVNVQPNASPQQHRIAYDINLACLSKIRGCAGQPAAAVCCAPREVAWPSMPLIVDNSPYQQLDQPQPIPHC